MRVSQLAVLAIMVFFATGLTATPQAASPRKSSPSRGKDSSEQLPFADARNMTLMIFFADPPPQQGMLPIAHTSASGSGVWIGKNGYVATCEHVVRNWHGPFKIGFARSAFVNEGGLSVKMGATVNTWDADLVASDPNSDVAILKAHISPSAAQPAPLVTGAPLGGTQITPQVPLSPEGAILRTEFPRLGELLLLSGYPIGQRTLILQAGSATGLDLLPAEDSAEHGASGLRIFLSLVSNPGNSGGPILDAQSRVVGLLEGNLNSPIRDKEGRQLYSPTVKHDANGNPAKDPSGQFLYDITPLQQNSGISIAVPARSISELAKEKKLNLE